MLNIHGFQTFTSFFTIQSHSKLSQYPIIASIGRAVPFDLSSLIKLKDEKKIVKYNALLSNSIYEWAIVAFRLLCSIVKINSSYSSSL